MDITMHIIRFDEWCKKCQHQKTEDKDSPCNECLDEPANVNSRQPVMFKEKERA